MWNNGEFNNFIISPETKQVTDGGQTYQTKYAFIPLNQFNKDKFFTSSGKDDDEMLDLYMMQLKKRDQKQ